MAVMRLDGRFLTEATVATKCNAQRRKLLLLVIRSVISAVVLVKSKKGGLVLRMLLLGAAAAKAQISSHILGRKLVDNSST